MNATRWHGSDGPTHPSFPQRKKKKKKKKKKKTRPDHINLRLIDSHQSCNEWPINVTLLADWYDDDSCNQQREKWTRRNVYLQQACVDQDYTWTTSTRLRDCQLRSRPFIVQAWPCIIMPFATGIDRLWRHHRVIPGVTSESIFRYAHQTHAIR